MKIIRTGRRIAVVSRSAAADTVAVWTEGAQCSTNHAKQLLAPRPSDRHLSRQRPCTHLEWPLQTRVLLAQPSQSATSANNFIARSIEGSEHHGRTVCCGASGLCSYERYMDSGLCTCRARSSHRHLKSERRTQETAAMEGARKLRLEAPMCFLLQSRPGTRVFTRASML